MSDKIDQDIELQDELVEDVEALENEENLDEAKGHNPETAEADSLASVDQAADSTKQAPARKGDKKNSDPMPKTKAAMLQAAYQKMSKMNKNEMVKAYEAMCEDTDAENAIIEGNFDEDLNALVESEATLSEGFKDKASVIFEAALQSKLSEHVARLEEQYTEELAEEVGRIESNLVEKVDGYLNYVVEQWMEDNKIAVETGLRTEIAESFMSALQGVFTEHYIEVPEGKADLVDELATKVEELEEKLNDSIDDNIKLTESNKAMKRDAIIRESSTGLSEAQAEKLKSLVEGVDFSDAETFEEKVETIKESYFKEAKSESLTEEAEAFGDETEEVQVSGHMAAYLSALKKTNK